MGASLCGQLSADVSLSPPGGDLRCHGLESWSWTQLFGFRSQEIASSMHEIARVYRLPCLTLIRML